MKKEEKIFLAGHNGLVGNEFMNNYLNKNLKI